MPSVARSIVTMGTLPICAALPRGVRPPFSGMFTLAFPVSRSIRTISVFPCMQA
ncbi:hypothetical protein BJX62DRAFT_203324 [Aspergillus germanicus]